MLDIISMLATIRTSKMVQDADHEMFRHKTIAIIYVSMELTNIHHGALHVQVLLELVLWRARPTLRSEMSCEI